MTAPTSEHRALPRDKDAEHSLLGSMLINPTLIPDLATIVRAEDFYFPANQLVYQAITTLADEGKDVDAILVASRLGRDDNLTRIGGAAHLHTLVSSVPTTANATHYADIVAEQATLRRLIDAGNRVAQLGYSGEDGADTDVLVDMAEQAVGQVARGRDAQDYASLAETLPPAVEELAAISENGGLAQGIPTGFTDLDKLTNGLHGGQMVIVAARPGVGKSTIGLDIMRSASIRHDKTSAIFSLEMSQSEITLRLLSAETGIKLSDMRAGSMTPAQWDKLTQHIDKISTAPLYIDDSASLTMMDIRSKARRLKSEHDLGLVVVDYLQLMSSGKQVESRQQEVSEFSRQLKLMAKELDVPVIAISQLNRGPENRPDKKPQLSDLRESGSLEQDADIVILLNRPDSQDKDDERAGEADIIIAKHRGGPIDTIPVAHQLHYSRFVNMAHQ